MSGKTFEEKIKEAQEKYGFNPISKEYEKVGALYSHRTQRLMLGMWTYGVGVGISLVLFFAMQNYALAIFVWVVSGLAMVFLRDYEKIKLAIEMIRGYFFK